MTPNISVEAEHEALKARILELETALRPFAKIEVPHGSSDGTWVAKTIFCNDQVTAFSVLNAREALGNLERPA